jgi:hypothetical protein
MDSNVLDAETMVANQSRSTPESKLAAENRPACL